MRFNEIFFVLLLGFLPAVAMEKGEDAVVTTEDCWDQVPDEVVVYILHFAADSKTVSGVIKNLAIVKLVRKRFAGLAKDLTLMKALLRDKNGKEDYQKVLNKMLFIATCSGNETIIELLAELPSASLSSPVVDGDNLSADSNQDSGFIPANVNNLDNVGYSPLLHAAERGHLKLVKLFLISGATPVIKNKNKDTALMLAANKGHQEIVTELLLLEEVINAINDKGFGGNSAFLCAAKQCIYTSEKNREDLYFDILKVLANHGADVNASDAADLAAMDWAAKEGKIRLISMLLDLKAHFSEANKASLEVCLMGVLLNEEVNELLGKIRVLEQKAPVIEIELQLITKPYWLRFRISGTVYNIEVANDCINKKFTEQIRTLDNHTVFQIGDAIVQEVFATGSIPGTIVNNCSYDANDYRLALKLIFGQLFFEPYDCARESNDIEAMGKIRQIVQPIFMAFPDKANSIYGNNLKKYGLKN